MTSLLLAGQELRHPLRGCAYDILGFILGFALVVAAVAADPARALAPLSSGPGAGANATLICVAPFLVVLTLSFAARRWLFLRLVAAFGLGFYAAALLLAVAILALGGSV